ncbi:MAG: hypothetical protein ACRCZG_02325, partial [Culicoidibacterales bacterium]
MTLLNLVAVVLLGKHALKLLKDYDNQKKAGIVDPIFTIANVTGIENVTEWDALEEDEEQDNELDLQSNYQPPAFAPMN